MACPNATGVGQLRSGGIAYALLRSRSAVVIHACWLRPICGRSVRMRCRHRKARSTTAELEIEP